MAKFFLDCEFFEGFHKPLFGRRRHLIDLISIALVGEDGKEYYAVSNEFDLKAAWKDEWLRENVLKPIHWEMRSKEVGAHNEYYAAHQDEMDAMWQFTFKNFKLLISIWGKSNREICREIQIFTGREACDDKFGMFSWYWPDKPEFYAYYADYDWVLFCSLFGRMIDLPPEFPQYCRDLKQTMDEKVAIMSAANTFSELRPVSIKDGERKVFISNGVWLNLEKDGLINHPDYPIQKDEHNALADARWNYELYKFLKSL